MFIPENLRTKLISPKDNNPLGIVAKKEKVSVLGELSINHLLRYFHKDRQLFDVLVQQLGFLGVQFSGELARYNLLRGEESPFLLRIHHSMKEEPINFSEPALAKLRYTLSSYGIISKGELDGVPVAAVENLSRGDRRVVEALKGQGFCIDDKLYDSDSDDGLGNVGKRVSGEGRPTEKTREDSLLKGYLDSKTRIQAVFV